MTFFRAQVAKMLSFLLKAVISSNKSILCGIPPLASDTNKNPFGKAFVSTAERSKARVDWLFMDQSLIQIARDDLPKFVDSLVVEMTA